MPLQRINLDYFGEMARLHCPVCGHAVYHGELADGFCSHLIFAGDTLSGKAIWLQEDIEDRFKIEAQRLYETTGRHLFYDTLDVWLRTLGVDKIADETAALLNTRSAFMLTITTSDKGCGGMCNGTILAIFDFSAK